MWSGLKVIIPFLPGMYMVESTDVNEVGEVNYEPSQGL